MSGEVTRKPTGLPATHMRRRNYMTFPKELRNAIPDLPTYVGRTLELSGIDGHASNTRLYGARINLNLGLQETGELKGRFTVRMDLEVEAARALAASILALADRAEKLPESVPSPVSASYRKRK